MKNHKNTNLENTNLETGHCFCGLEHPVGTWVCEDCGSTIEVDEKGYTKIK